MHDTFLLNRISDSLSELCKINRIIKVNKLCITTSQDSHLNQYNLLEQLLADHKELVGEWTEIEVDRKDIESLTAVIDSLEGETVE